MKNKSKIITGLLLFMVIFLLGAIAYVSTVLLNDNPSKTGTSLVAPIKSKAAGRTYTKLLALNQTPANNNPDATPTSDVSSSLLSPTSVPTGEVTPTETLLAVNNVSPTITSSLYMSPTESGSPTGVSTLPETGYISNTLILFAVSSLFLFIAFLF